jgi:acetoacetate decarboxylase
MGDSPQGRRQYPRGYTAPLSADGRAGLVLTPPWHYSADFLLVEYRTDPDGVIALLPKELEPAQDPGAVAAIFADWQVCSDDGHELLDPVQGQYKEFFLVVGCTFRGAPASRCVFIWVDKDFAMMRGWIQGFPKKLGAIHMTRIFPVGRATPRIEAGARFGATCTAGSREIARAVVTLRRLSDSGPTVNGPPMHNTRLFPAYSGVVPDVFELVRAGGQDRFISDIWEGDAELSLGSHTIEPLDTIRPKEILKGYRFSFGYTVNGGQVLLQHDKPAHGFEEERA